MLKIYPKFLSFLSCGTVSIIEFVNIIFSRLLITMAVPAGIEYIEKGYDIPKLNKYLDWFNILSYDYHSAYEPSVNHHSPLYSLEEESEYNFDSDLNIVSFLINISISFTICFLGSYNQTLYKAWSSKR